MFLASVLQGVVVALHWQLWLVAASIVAVQLAYQRTADRAFMRGIAERDVSTLMSRKYIVIGLVANGLMASLLLALALPLMWGSLKPLSLAQLAQDIDSVLIVGLLAGTLMAFLFSGPLLGRLVPVAVQWFLQGVIIARALSATASFASDLPSQLRFPGILASVAFLLIAFLVTGLVMALGTLVSALVGKEPATRGRIPVPISMTLGTIGGLLPVFMYIRYAALQSGVTGL